MFLNWIMPWNMRMIMRPQCADGCLGSMDSKACTRAAKAGHLECLKYAHENGCRWTKRTCSHAAAGGHLDCLEYAHEHGCQWADSEDETCWSAAAGGHLECLKYAHEQGCHWDVWTCSDAAKGGHLDCLKYAHEHGCPWDKETSSFVGSLHNLHDRELYIAVIIYAGMPKSDATAKAIIDKVLLIRRMKDACKHAAATRIQRFWKERMYRPGGAGMLGAGKRFCLMSQNA